MDLPFGSTSHDSINKDQKLIVRLFNHPKLSEPLTPSPIADVMKEHVLMKRNDDEIPMFSSTGGIPPGNTRSNYDVQVKLPMIKSDKNLSKLVGNSESTSVRKPNQEEP